MLALRRDATEVNHEDFVEGITQVSVDLWYSSEWHPNDDQSGRSGTLDAIESFEAS